MAQHLAHRCSAVTLVSVYTWQCDSLFQIQISNCWFSETHCNIPMAFLWKQMAMNCWRYWFSYTTDNVEFVEFMKILMYSHFQVGYFLYILDTFLKSIWCIVATLLLSDKTIEAEWDTWIKCLLSAYHNGHKILSPVTQIVKIERKRGASRMYTLPVTILSGPLHLICLITFLQNNKSQKTWTMSYCTWLNLYTPWPVFSKKDTVCLNHRV